MRRLLNDFWNNDLAARAGFVERKGEGNPLITGLAYDSRAVKEGFIFFALRGIHSDGRDYIEQALKNGAALIVCEEFPYPRAGCADTPKEVLKNSHKTKARICADARAKNAAQKRTCISMLGAFWASFAPRRRAKMRVYAKNVVFQHIPNPYSLILVKDARFAMSPIAAAFYGEPSKRLCVIGVTGTEGKSTTVFLIWQLLRLAGKKAGFISTVAFSEGGEEQPNPEHQTTPEATQIHAALARMLDAGCEFAVLETSSHGLSPRTNRLGDITFDAAVMTNVTHEHLEFHGTWEQYRDDKANLFRALRTGGFGVVNLNDPSAEYFSRVTDKEVFGFSLGGESPPPLQPAAANLWSAAGGLTLPPPAGGSPPANRNRAALAARFPSCTPPSCTHKQYRITNLQSTAEGSTYTLINDASTINIQDKLPGAFNALNVSAALIVVLRITQTPIKNFINLVPLLKPVRGRMTAINEGQPFEVLVDYAHTPSSFETIFPPLRSRIDSRGAGGRIIALFGSGGERDTQKRPRQGTIADNWCDIIILADEDPRGEDPQAILEEIAAGIKNKKRGETLFLIPERSEAIRKAVSLARAGDIVLLLGKGHENSIIYSRGGRKTISYDEISCAQLALKAALKGIL